MKHSRSIGWVAAFLTAAAVVVALAAPVSAASQKPIVVDLDDPAVSAEDSAFWTGACGFPVVAEASGHIIFHVDAHGGPITEIAVYNMRETLTSPYGTFRIVDTGPDITYVQGGTTYVAGIGRSTTGTSVTRPCRLRPGRRRDHQRERKVGWGRGPRGRSDPHLRGPRAGLAIS